MSYVSAASLAPARAARPVSIRTAAIARPRPLTDGLARATGVVSASLETGLLVVLMSGLSLVLCTVAAGAF